MAKIDFCSFESVLEGVKKCLLIPRPKVPRIPSLLVLLAKGRPGLSSSKITAGILSRRSEAGINPLSPEMEKLIRIIVEEIVEGITQDARMTIAINPGIPVTAGGANAAGPVICQGSTTAPGSGTGVIQ